MIQQQSKEGLGSFPHHKLYNCSTIVHETTQQYQSSLLLISIFKTIKKVTIIQLNPNSIVKSMVN